MSYETISVRMNRSDPSIRWGFLFGSSGGNTVVSRVEKDSLSEKAGLREGDIVMSVCDRSALSLAEAQRSADSARLEITFHLKRHVTSHTCLPWTLTEKDNKLYVEEIPAGFGGQKSSSTAYSSSQNQWQSGQNIHPGGYSTQTKHSDFSQTRETRGSGAPWTTERNIPVQQTHHGNSSYQGSNVQQQQRRVESGAAPFVGGGSSSSQQGRNIQSSTYSSESKNFASSGAPAPERVFHSPSSFASSMKNTGWNRERQYQLGSDRIPNQSYSAQFYNPDSAGAQGGHANGTLPQNYSYNNGATSAPFGVGSGGLPLNQQTFINTSSSPIPLPQSSVSPGGTKVFYHSPSPRTRSQLSPNASIHHLQYNSPMNLYSTESCAEQYTQQTGRPVETQSRTTTPAYLTSETKRLIQEGEALRGPSPSAQSSSFKRISQAVGEPVH